VGRKRKKKERKVGEGGDSKVTKIFLGGGDEISPKFDLKNMISTYTKVFPKGKNGPNSPYFKGKNS
jgi:hypothetical protein